MTTPRPTIPELVAECRIDEYQAAYLRRQGYTADSPHPNPDLERIKQALLAIAGVAVCLPTVEVHADQLSRRARLVEGGGAAFKQMAVSRCHQNAANLWALGPDRYSIATGYAMSTDHIWRQHSWLLDRLYAQQIVETTEPRVFYWGFVMDHEECRRFCDGDEPAKRALDAASPAPTPGAPSEPKVVEALRGLWNAADALLGAMPDNLPAALASDLGHAADAAEDVLAELDARPVDPPPPLAMPLTPAVPEVDALARIAVHGPATIDEIPAMLAAQLDQQISAEVAASTPELARSLLKPTHATPEAIKRLAGMPFSDALREYFTPGNVVLAYGGIDRVVAFHETGHPGIPHSDWAVTVVGLDGGDRVGRPRLHCTAPDFAQLRRQARLRQKLAEA